MKFSKPSKEKLAIQFINYPALNSLVCLILYERSFRITFFGALLLVPLVLLCALKVWPATPAHFQPLVKVSALDWVQANSLRRSAIKHAALGRFEKAFQSWRIAVANNPGDPELVRGLLRHLLQRADGRNNSQFVTGYSSWLRRLTATNGADLELIAKLYETYHLNDLLVSMLAPLESKLTAPAQAAY